MAKIKLKQVDQIGRKKVSDAYDSFMRHCKLKNLAPYSILYYEKNVGFFLDSLPQVRYVNEITQEKIADFVSMLMDRGNRVTAINARLRAAFFFFAIVLNKNTWTSSRFLRSKKTNLSKNLILTLNYKSC